MMDYQNKELFLDNAIDCIESPVFDDMRSNFNIELGCLLEKLSSGSFREGEVTLKLKIGYTQLSQYFPQKDKGKTIEVPYKKLEMSHKVSLSLKHKSEIKDNYKDEKAFKFEDGRFIADDIPTEQVTFDDLPDDQSA